MGSNFYSRPCGRGDGIPLEKLHGPDCDFYSRPCGRGDIFCITELYTLALTFLLTPLREGRHCGLRVLCDHGHISTHAPAGGATLLSLSASLIVNDFYSRPCGRGDALDRVVKSDLALISTHAPAGGATQARTDTVSRGKIFLLTPLREGRLVATGDAI